MSVAACTVCGSGGTKWVPDGSSYRCRECGIKMTPGQLAHVDRVQAEIRNWIRGQA